MSDRTTHFEVEPETTLAALKAGHLQHSMRENFPGYAVGHILALTDGRGEDWVQMEITYITSKENQCALSPTGLNPDYCILSLKLLP